MIFSCSRIRIVSTTIILVLKLAQKDYQRNKFTFSVKADEECLFSGQKPTNMDYKWYFTLHSISIYITHMVRVNLNNSHQYGDTLNKFLTKGY